MSVWSRWMINRSHNIIISPVSASRESAARASVLARLLALLLLFIIFISICSGYEWHTSIISSAARGARSASGSYEDSPSINIIYERAHMIWPNVSWKHDGAWHDRKRSAAVCQQEQRMWRLRAGTAPQHRSRPPRELQHRYLTVIHNYLFHIY